MTMVKNMSMKKHNSEAKPKPLPKFHIVKSSFSLEDVEYEEERSGHIHGAIQAKKLLSISEEHSDGEATPKSKPLDGFGDNDLLKKPNRRRASIQKANTTVLDKTSSVAVKPETFNVKVDIRPKLKGPDNKVTPI